MTQAKLVAPARSHLLTFVRALTSAGWRIDQAPADANLVRNGQRIVLRAKGNELRFRLFIYKVTGSGRSKPDERRIEITSTYQKGLTRARGFSDVVLGYHADRKIFVGVDPRRISHGGRTGNASSFFDRDGLEWRRADEILIRPRSARLFNRDLEFHAFVRPPRLAEYLFSLSEIHDGSYLGGGPYSGNKSDGPGSLTTDRAQGEVLVLTAPNSRQVRRRVRKPVADAFEKGDAIALKRKRISAEEFQELKRQMEENGRLGEEFVLNDERRSLRRLGKKRLAERVRWVSQDSVYAGYDILSFEPNGDEKWIEVKATSGVLRTFEMSDNEWRTGCSAGDKYYIYRVTEVRINPRIERVRNPKLLESQGLITKSTKGWKVTLL